VLSTGVDPSAAMAMHQCTVCGTRSTASASETREGRVGADVTASHIGRVDAQASAPMHHRMVTIHAPRSSEDVRHRW
jgi:hypothetical protein